MENCPLKSIVARLVVMGAFTWTVSIAPALANPSSAGDAALISVTAAAYVDSDGDGLSDSVESALGTDPVNFDSDSDGMPDGWEIWNALDPTNADDAYGDANGDGLTNLEKFELGLDPYACDSDGDGYWDVIEYARGTDGACPSSYPKSGVACDVDQNGAVNAVDVQFVINGALGMQTPVPTNINTVGGTDAIDVQMVILSALGIRS